MAFEGNSSQSEKELDRKEKTREETIQEMIEDNHPLVQRIKDPHWVSDITKEHGNTGSQKGNIKVALNVTSREIGFELDFVTAVFKAIQEKKEQERERLVKEAMEKRKMEQKRRRI